MTTLSTLTPQPTRSWSEDLALTRRNLVEQNGIERVFRRFLPTRIEKADRARPGGAHWSAIKRLEYEAMEILLALGPDQLRAELQPIAHIVAPAVENALSFEQHDRLIPSDLLDRIHTVCLYEIVGMDLSPEVLASFRPYLIRIRTDAHDPDYRSWHWDRGLIALALDEPKTWRSIAGLLPGESLTFQPGATFQFNVQGLLRHLAAAIEHKADVADVLPAFHDLIRCAPLMWSTTPEQANQDTCLWAARLVHHHIGGQPLGTVGQFFYDAVHAAAAQEAA